MHKDLVFINWRSSRHCLQNEWPLEQIWSCQALVYSYASSFYKSQNVLGWSTFFVSDQKLIYILCQTKRRFKFGQEIWFLCQHKIFGTSTECNTIFSPKHLDQPKTFGPSPNILEHVDGQGIIDLNRAFNKIRRGQLTSFSKAKP